VISRPSGALLEVLDVEGSEFERALLQDAERCELGELSGPERIALADKLADLAQRHLWRAQKLARMGEEGAHGRALGGYDVWMRDLPRRLRTQSPIPLRPS
jgi:hypothetical protein